MVCLQSMSWKHRGETLCLEFDRSKSPGMTCFFLHNKPKMHIMRPMSRRESSWPASLPVDVSFTMQRGVQNVRIEPRSTIFLELQVWINRASCEGQHTAPTNDSKFNKTIFVLWYWFTYVSICCLRFGLGSSYTTNSYDPSQPWLKHIACRLHLFFFCLIASDLNLPFHTLFVARNAYDHPNIWSPQAPDLCAHSAK